MKKKKLSRKKKILLYPFLGLSIGFLMLGCWNTVIQPQSKKELWFSARPLPEKIAMNSYLKANEARKQQDLNIAIQSYLDVLEADPDNKSVLQTTYGLAMIRGTPEVLWSQADHLQEEDFVDYFKIARLYSQEDVLAATTLLNKKTPEPSDNLLKPLVRMWLFAKQGQKEKAIKELDNLPQKNKNFIYAYHLVLLGNLLNDSQLIKNGLEKMGDSELVAIGYFPLVYKIISQNGEWEMSSLYQRYLELREKYPVTADLLSQLGQTDLTFQKGLAESFYLVSILAGNGEISSEGALTLNSIALSLDPEKQLSLVWGGELLESLNLPRIASSYYERLKYDSATLRFKKATALVKSKQIKKALPELEDLYKTNATNLSLLTLLGQAYIEENRIDDALNIYNQLIPLLEQNMKHKALITAYTIRAAIYGRKEDNEKMLADFKRAKDLDPENADLLNDLGYNELVSGNIDEGFDLVQKAYQKSPNDPYILDSMAFGYFKKGNFASALPLAEKSLNLMPQSALVNAHLGDIYDSLGRHREAMFQYKKALDLKTDSTSELTKYLTTKLKEKK